MSNFIQSNRPDEGNPINLEHIITFKKSREGSTTMISFYASNGKTINWRYYGKKELRDKDYEELVQSIFMSKQENN